MSLSHRYRQLAALIETLESRGLGVQRADPLGDCEGEQSSDGGFVVQLRVELPADATADLFDAGRSGTAASPKRLPVGPSVPVGVKPAASASPVVLEGGEPADASEGAVGHDEAEAATEDDGDDAVVAESGAAEPEVSARSEDRGAADDVGTETADDDAELDEGSDDEESGAAGDIAESDDGESVAEGDEAAEATDAATTDDAVPCTHPDCDRTFDTARGMKIHRTKAHPLSELVDDERGRTVHRDPDALARVYDEHDTFAEMTAALDVDVGAQAVRKQMIRHGIHEPGAKESNGDATAERDDDGAIDRSASTASTSGVDGAGDDAAETDEADEAADPQSDVGVSSENDASLDDDTPVADRLPDLDLPGSLSTQDLLTAVEEANTLYDVQRALDVDQETARDVLTEYDLLELVSGRAAAVGDREALKAEIGQRIRRTAT